MVDNFERWDPPCRIVVKHFVEQVHEVGVLVEAVAFVLFERGWQALENGLLLDQNSLAFSALDPEDSLAQDGFAVDSGHPALEGHPHGEARDDFHEDYAEGPHVEAPRLAILAQLDGWWEVRLLVLSTSLQVLQDFRSKVLGGRRWDLCDIVELEGGSKIDKFNRLDICFVFVELNENIVRLDVGMNDAKFG